MLWRHCTDPVGDGSVYIGASAGDSAGALLFGSSANRKPSSVSDCAPEVYHGEWWTQVGRVATILHGPLRLATAAGWTPPGRLDCYAVPEGRQRP